MKIKGVKELKKDLWNIFSRYIRLRDSDWRGYSSCCTCGLTKQWKEMQAGHFIPGRHNSILFDERNVHAQCYGCNIRKQGNTVKYFRFMQEKYGDEIIEELEKLDLQEKSFTEIELKEMIDKYKLKLKEYEDRTI